MSSALVGQCPASLQKVVLPYLQRADELDSSKQIFPAYFLRTYVAQLILIHRNPSDAEQKKFLIDLMGELEVFKKAHPETDTMDGRTVVTRLALTLFARADEAERSGQCSPAVCKMFFMSSILFEATKQFNENQMDSIATEKHKYARFIAARLTKCLKEGGVYEPFKKAEVEAAQRELAGGGGAAAAAAAASSSDSAAPAADAHAAATVPGSMLSPSPQAAHVHDPVARPSAAPSSLQTLLPQVPPPPPYQPPAHHLQPKPATPAPTPQYEQHLRPDPGPRPNVLPPPPTAVAPDHAHAPHPPSGTAFPAPQKPYSPSHPSSPIAATAGSGPRKFQLPPPPPPGTTIQSLSGASVPGEAPGVHSAAAASMGERETATLRMMEAQKLAKQAVNALQFGDAPAATKLLQAALSAMT